MLMYVTKGNDLHKAFDGIASAAVKTVGAEITTEGENELDLAAMIDSVSDEEIRAAQKEYVRTHREALNAAQRRYYHKHKAKCKAYHKAWRAAHPDKVREYQRRAWAKRALKLRNQPPQVTDEDLRKILHDKTRQDRQNALETTSED